ncbi:hypothetical protein PRZ48_011898 [Zasmidium cellare]|uniref:F-box domain-containing protein n=1 Tax=Zasmidium cellare TaxID=395010 RepID=A0ABR0E7P3_ZASCE|nr:hypothetical protein PRZ48_011898 [Zasmidium cellare]
MATFTDLPQELRGHKMRQSGLAIRLASICRLTRQDILSLIWNKTPVVVNSLTILGLRRKVWNEDWLRHIEDLQVRVIADFNTRYNLQAMVFSIFERHGVFEVRLSIRQGGHATDQTSPRIVEEDLRVKYQPRAKMVQNLINDNGCITLKSITMLAEIHEEDESAWKRGRRNS